MIATTTILVDIMTEVTSAMVLPVGVGPINFVPGRGFQIIKSLQYKDNSITLKGLKYPLIAMLMPVKEKRGTGFYANVNIPRIIIAHLTKSGDGNEGVLEKYNSDGVFKTILYPCYYEFLKQLAYHPLVNSGDPDSFIHEKMDNPGQKQESEDGTNDFIDSIEILNLEFILNQFKKC